MSTSQHTPGPWYAHYIDPKDNEGYRFTIGRDPSSYGFWIARVCNAAEAAANARLIAAAPELLAALRKVVESYEDNPAANALAPWYLDAAAAISKAEGTA